MKSFRTSITVFLALTLLLALLAWKFWPSTNNMQLVASAPEATLSQTATTLKPGQVEAPKVAPAPVADDPTATDEDDILRADLKTAIPHLMHLLETKDYEKAFREYLPPDEYVLLDPHLFPGHANDPYLPSSQNEPLNSPIDKTMPDFAAMGNTINRIQRFADQTALLLDALHSIQGQTPVIDENGVPVSVDIPFTDINGTVHENQIMGYSGEKATYTPNPPSSPLAGDHVHLVFVWENGFWYLRGFETPF